MSEALGDDDNNIERLRFDGERLRAEVADAITGATLKRTIDTAPYVDLTLRDPHRTLLKSGIFDNRLTMQIDRFAFELAAVDKSGSSLGATFESLEVAALRRLNRPRVVAPGTMTRADFIRSLVSEERWLKVITPLGFRGEVVQVEMTRGNPTDPKSPDSEEKLEDTWVAIGRLADEIGWRRFVPTPGEVWFVPETWLFGQAPSMTIREHEGGVDDIDFQWDTGQPVAEVTVSCHASRWTAPPGSVVDVPEMGPASGLWMVSTISRSLFRTATTITLRKPRPTLPEPPPPKREDPSPGEGSTSDGARKASTSIGAATSSSSSRTPRPTDPGPESVKGYSWPVRGRIISGFGQRRGKLHAGVDIGVSVGTPVAATRDGTVTHAGQADGYGSAVYIQHGNAESRYGHLSRIDVRRGQPVKRGDIIGLSGGAKGAAGAGNSEGPHLHFEIRPGGKPADPMRFLP